MTARRGRRTGESDARATILEVARRQFGDLGYQRTTLRGVADRAGVDPRLVLHYFGSKAGLFRASVVLPVDPELVAERVFAEGMAGVGRRAADTLIETLEDPASRRALVGLLRAAMSEPEAATSIREVLTERLLGPISAHVGTDQPRVRAALVASLLVGLAVGRHIIALEPLAKIRREELVETLAPVIEYYLTGDLGRETVGRRDGEPATGEEFGPA